MLGRLRDTLTPRGSRASQSVAQDKALLASGSTPPSALEAPTGFHNKYSLGDKIGKGGFGQVYVATRVGATDERAVKIVDLRLASTGVHKLLRNEVSVWSKLKPNANCVQLHEVFNGDSLYYMVMEKCNCSLFRHLDNLGDDCDERGLGEIFAQMLMGIKHVHSAGVIHRDIKPDNFVVGGDDGTTVKLGDFGLASKMGKEKSTGECGTAPFMCPEMIAKNGYDTAADMWSFAVIVYVLLFGRFPYTPKTRTSQDMKLAILGGTDNPSFGTKIPLTSSVVAFSMNTLIREPEKRPTAKAAMQMNFMRSVIKKRHEVGNDSLPSLRPTLGLALKVGAFEIRALERDDVDALLNTLQHDKIGKTISDTTLPRFGNSSSMKAEVQSRCSASTKSISNNSLSTRASTASRSTNRKSLGGESNGYFSIDFSTFVDGDFRNDGSSTCSL